MNDKTTALFEKYRHAVMDYCNSLAEYGGENQASAILWRLVVHVEDEIKTAITESQAVTNPAQDSPPR